MKVQETVTIERDIYVAPCLECGHTDILLTDSNYSSGNIGGGKCKKCGHESTGAVSCIPKIDDLARIWNAANDIPTLIKAEEAKIAAAQKRIDALKGKGGPAFFLKPITGGDGDVLLTLEKFVRGSRDYTSDDGNGYWATATHKSDISVFKAAKPDWATHVLWYDY